MAETPDSSPFDVLKAPPDESALVNCLRNVKNQIIGNKHKKIEYRESGLIPLIVEQAEKYTSHAVHLQVSAILYSMAAGDGTEAALAIQAAEGLQLLCGMLTNEDNDLVVLGAARALKHIYDCAEVSVAPLAQPSALAALLRLAAQPQPDIARFSIQILSALSRSADTSTSTAPDMLKETISTVHSSLMHALLQQLPRCLYVNPDQPSAPFQHASTSTSAEPAAARMQHKAPTPAPQRFVPLRITVLTALDTLLRCQPPAMAQDICSCFPDVAAAIKYADADTRMGACALIATLLRSPRLSLLRNSREWPQARDRLYDMFVCGSSAEQSDKWADNAPAKDAAVLGAVERTTLAALIKLQAIPSLRAQVPLRLVELMAESPPLQRAVADSSALEHLTAYVLSQTEKPPWRRSSSTGTVAMDTSSTEAGPSSEAGPSTSKAAPPASPVAPAPPDPDEAPTPPTPEATAQLLSALQCIMMLCSCDAPAPVAAQVGAAAGSSKGTAGGAAQSAQCVRNCKMTATAANLRAFANCLRHPSAEVREAAALVFRVLGRCSEATTKECFGEAPLAIALVDALQDEEERVQAAACFAICNLCAITSCPARPKLLEQGAISKLVDITKSSFHFSPQSHLPEVAVWALGNAVNRIAVAERERLLTTWPWNPTARGMLTHPTAAVRMRTWQLLQNLSHASDDHDVQKGILKWTENELLPLVRCTVEECLSGSRGAAHDGSASSPAPMDAVDTVSADQAAVEASNAAPLPTTGQANGQQPPAPRVPPASDSWMELPAHDFVRPYAMGASGPAADSSRPVGLPTPLPAPPVPFPGASGDPPTAEGARDADGAPPGPGTWVGEAGSPSLRTTDFSDPRVATQQTLRELSEIAGAPPRSSSAAASGGGQTGAAADTTGAAATASHPGHEQRTVGADAATDAEQPGTPIAAGQAGGGRTPQRVGHNDSEQAVGMHEAERMLVQSKVLACALYLVSNLATGEEAVKQDVMNSGIPELLPKFLSYTGGDRLARAEVRTAACWLAINLTHVESGAYQGSGGAPAVEERARTLDGYGVLQALKSLLDEAEDLGKAELGPRARAAVKNFDKLREGAALRSSPDYMQQDYIPLPMEDPADPNQ